MGYMENYQRRKVKRFQMEERICVALSARLKNGKGWTRIRMKSDGQDIDIRLSEDGQYLLSFPAYEKHHSMNVCFTGIDSVAEFLMQEGWKRR